MSAPQGTDAPISEAEAVARVLDLTADPSNDGGTSLAESDRTLQGVLYTGGSTEYAHIYLAAVTGTYNGNRMMWLRYVWLSKPGAFESDMWGENGISLRMVDGMPNALASLVASACNRMGDADDDREPFYTEAK